MTIKVRPNKGRLEKHTANLDNREFYYVTGSNIGEDKTALDVRPLGAYRVGAADRVAELGSTDTLVKLTAHDIRKGDLIRFTSVANNILETEAIVKRIVDVDFVELEAVLSASITAGDTFDILRSVTPRYTSDGASLASVIAPPIEFMKDGLATQVNEDTITPANNAPLPVKLTSITGDINITAGDLNVNTSHAGVNYDSMRVGDGTNLMAVNASLEAQVRDDDANTELAAMSAKLPAALGQDVMANSLTVAIASDQSAIDVNDIGGTISLPTGASTEAKQDDAITELQALNAIDYATETTLAAMSAKLPAALGQAARAASLTVAQCSEDQVIQGAIQTAVELIDNAISGTEMQVDLVDLGGAATEAKQDDIVTELQAIGAQLPSAIGQNLAADSLSVVIASDQNQVTLPIEDILAFAKIDLNGVTTAAYTEVIASVGATAIKRIQIFNGQGEPLYLAVGGAGSEVNKMIIPPGGFPDTSIPVSISGGVRVSVKAIDNNISSSAILIINFIG